MRQGGAPKSDKHDNLKIGYLSPTTITEQVKYFYILEDLQKYISCLEAVS